MYTDRVGLLFLLFSPLIWQKARFSPHALPMMGMSVSSPNLAQVQRVPLAGMNSFPSAPMFPLVCMGQCFFPTTWVKASWNSFWYSPSSSAQSASDQVKGSVSCPSGPQGINGCCRNRNFPPRVVCGSSRKSCSRGQPAMFLDWHFSHCTIASRFSPKAAFSAS